MSVLASYETDCVQPLIMLAIQEIGKMTDKINDIPQTLVKTKPEAVRADLQVLKAQEQLLVDLLRDSEGRQ